MFGQALMSLAREQDEQDRERQRGMQNEECSSRRKPGLSSVPHSRFIIQPLRPLTSLGPRGDGECHAVSYQAALQTQDLEIGRAECTYGLVHSHHSHKTLPIKGFLGRDMDAVVHIFSNGRQLETGATNKEAATEPAV